MPEAKNSRLSTSPRLNGWGHADAKDDPKRDAPMQPGPGRATSSCHQLYRSGAGTVYRGLYSGGQMDHEDPKRDSRREWDHSRYAGLSSLRRGSWRAQLLRDLRAPSCGAARASDASRMGGRRKASRGVEHRRSFSQIGSLDCANSVVGPATAASREGASFGDRWRRLTLLVSGSSGAARRPLLLWSW